MRRSKFVFLSGLILAILLLSGCSYVQVINTSELSARVMVSFANSGGGTTKYIKSGESVDVFNSTGGAYTVQVLPDEKYRQLLLDLQNEITKRLWDERETLSGSDVTRLVNQLNDIDSQLEKVAEEGASCSGTVPEYETVVVILSYDGAKANWSLSCP